MKSSVVIDLKIQHAGVFQSLMQEFERHRLPRLLRLKDKVDRGEAINDVDFEFLCKEIKAACLTKNLTFSYPELQSFCLQMGHFYKELCDKATQNESTY